MRLSILDSGHSFATKAILLLIRASMKVPVPDIVKTLMYRPDFFGKPMGGVVREAMRGPSEWSIAEREMMAAYVSKVNECEF
jgi:hypothetical protein